DRPSHVNLTKVARRQASNQLDLRSLGGHLFFYAQRTLDNRIAIGGRGAPYEVGSPIVKRSHDPQVRTRLESALRRHFPATANAAITHAWSGPLAVLRDWCMSVTFDRDRQFGWAGG
ncbi:MAG: hypothetical protein ACR2IK_08580, partial [Chloroflexota bacterium]